MEEASEAGGKVSISIQTHMTCTSHVCEIHLPFGGHGVRSHSNTPNSSSDFSKSSTSMRMIRRCLHKQREVLYPRSGSCTVVPVLGVQEHRLETIPLRTPQKFPFSAHFFLLDRPKQHFGGYFEAKQGKRKDNKKKNYHAFLGAENAFIPQFKA